MPKSAAPPLSIDCVACGTKMELTAEEPSDRQTTPTGAHRRISKNSPSPSLNRSDFLDSSTGMPAAL
jgi:hypothetical protein